ncbi:MAG: bifunctional N-acetylglucosamine-1-phosphate uridyltransferase/glucosamine-1-phosphate acetyltransferase [Candidatus Omnitrophica bacterium]|nr:bifunctional N-acetylglucosamine-1-phosphate uridyltransferase/glucosamine-1-phosphate acetyltransferase [Candidatus Omnitrophota bacterium]
MKPSLDVLILAAGRGTRMNSELPKVLHLLQGVALIQYVIESVLELGVNRIVIVVGYGESEVRKALSKYGDRIEFVRQEKQLGTGHAVNSAAKVFKEKFGDVLILAGDAPFLGKKILSELILQHRKSGSQASILSARVVEPKGYGRIVRNLKDGVLAIREELDASSDERGISEINSGAYVFNKSHLFRVLGKIKATNKKGEYYLTDTIEFLIREGAVVSAFCLVGEEEVMGINSRKDLVKANLALYQKKAVELLESGVTVMSPENTFIASDVTVGQDSIIYPFTYIERNVKIGKGCRIGPFTHIREGSHIEDKAQIGSFVEVVRSRVGKGTNIKHLSYVGDARVGAKANLGAGTITANYDGSKKHKTIIGDGAFIGSNTVLIAPVKVGKNAKTGAGSVILADNNIPNGQVFAGVPAKKIGNRK